MKMHSIELFPIHTIEEVKQFFKLLTSKGINFHPDEEFIDYVISGTGGKSSFTQELAEDLDRHMIACFEVCDREGIDIYELAFDTLNNK